MKRGKGGGARARHSVTKEAFLPPPRACCFMGEAPGGRHPLRDFIGGGKRAEVEEGVTAKKRAVIKVTKLSQNKPSLGENHVPFVTFPPLLALAFLILGPLCSSPHRTRSPVGRGEMCQLLFRESAQCWWAGGKAVATGCPLPARCPTA